MENGSDEGEGGGGGVLLDLGAIGILIQEADPGGTAIIDGHNGFNDLIRLAIMCTVQNCQTEGAPFVFNCYKHYV